MMGLLRRHWPALIALLVAACVARPVAQDGTPLPPGLADADDLRGAYRAALCPRLTGEPGECQQMLRRFAGERPAPRPPAADPARYRLLFVPGFLATCFSGIASFADVVAAARAAGYDAQVLETGGRDSVAANGRALAAQIDRLPADGRRLIVVGHSKGAADALQMIVDRPDIARQVDAVVGIAAAYMGSPLADRLHGVYRATLSANPMLRCPPGEGDPLDDLRPERRREWWSQHRYDVPMPVYSIVTVPDPDRVSPVLALPYGGLSAITPYNDGQLIAGDQVAPGGRLLGVVNADHLTAAIPYPTRLPFALMFRDVAFPRPAIVLAAIDVAVAQK